MDDSRCKRCMDSGYRRLVIIKLEKVIDWRNLKINNSVRQFSNPIINRRLNRNKLFIKVNERSHNRDIENTQTRIK